MNINTKNLVSITEANQNFSKVARLVDENGSVIILKNNVPRYLVMEFSAAEQKNLLMMKISWLFPNVSSKRTGRLMRYLPNDPIIQTTDTSAARTTHCRDRRFIRPA